MSFAPAGGTKRSRSNPVIRTTKAQEARRKAVAAAAAPAAGTNPQNRQGQKSPAAPKEPPPPPPPRPPTPPLREAPPPGAGQLFIEWSDRYTPETGFRPLDIQALHDAAEKRKMPRTPLLTTIFQYQWGDIAEESLASALIDALFARDFYDDNGNGSGKHWDMPYNLVEEIAEDKKKPGQAPPPLAKGQPAVQGPQEEAVLPWRVFKCECKSTWDWKDIYAVASSKTQMAFSPDRTKIQLREYSHYCSG